MEYINSTLGIPVKGHFHDHTSSRFANASGRSSTSGLNKMNFVKLSPLGFALSLIGDAKKRANEVMGYPSNPVRDKMEHYKKDIVFPKYPFNSNMPSEKLAGIIDSLTKDYEYENSRLPALVSLVANNNKSFSVSPNREAIATIQDVRGMMQVINEYRADVIKAYDKAFAREEKAAETPAPTTPTPSNQPPPVGAALPPTGTSVGLGTGISDTAEKLKNVASEGVNVGGKKIPLMTIALVAAGAGAVYYFFIRK